MEVFLSIRRFLLSLQTLYERCDRLRPALFRLASDTMDDDAALAQILAANDELTLAVNAYKEKVGSKECNGGRERSRSEEEMEGITKGWPCFCASSPCREHLNLVFASALFCFVFDDSSCSVSSDESQRD